MFDVTLSKYSAGTDQHVRFQNSIQSIFSRVRLLYGATPLEDVINYNQIMRSLTEWTSTTAMDQTSIHEGVGGAIIDGDQSGTTKFGNCNVRQKYIQGISLIAAPNDSNFLGGSGFGYVGDPNPPSGGASDTVTRRYQINFGLGLFTQDKLIPTKFMASQLSVELTLAQSAECIYCPATGTGTDPTYFLSNVNLVPEILQFDASYDSMFLKGLREGGVPIKFSSWHTFIFSSNSGSNVSLLVQERSRSVKALFAVQKRPTTDLTVDNGATFFDTAAAGSSTLQSYQYRIGGRYFPAAPVQCAQNGGSVGNGAAEAYVELAKALNIVGDYRLSTNTSAKNWAIQTSVSGVLPEHDYTYQLAAFTTGTQNPVYGTIFEQAGNSFCATTPSSSFAMAINLETTNGVEISGLNAEEQSDIALIANWKSAQVTGAAGVATNIEVYSYYDAMIILRENNVIELIQ